MTKWIPVEERLPDIKEPVVYTTKKPGRKGWLVGIAYWTKSEKWNPDFNAMPQPEFTHWMPLPDPPGE